MLAVHLRAPCCCVQHLDLPSVVGQNNIATERQRAGAVGGRRIRAMRPDHVSGLSRGPLYGPIHRGRDHNVAEERRRGLQRPEGGFPQPPARYQIVCDETIAPRCERDERTAPIWRQHNSPLDASSKGRGSFEQPPLQIHQPDIPTTSAKGEEGLGCRGCSRPQSSLHVTLPDHFERSARGQRDLWNHHQRLRQLDGCTGHPQCHERTKQAEMVKAPDQKSHPKKKAPNRSRSLHCKPSVNRNPWSYRMTKAPSRLARSPTPTAPLVVPMLKFA